MKRITVFCIALVISLLFTSQVMSQDTKPFLQACFDPINMPYSGLGEDPPGFDYEIGKMIAKKIGHRFTTFWINTGSQGGIGKALRQSIQGKECNAFFGIPAEEDMLGELEEKGLVLSQTYMVVSEVIVVRPDSPKVYTLDDLANLNTAVQFRTLGQGILIRRKFKRTFFRFPNLVLDGLENGEADVALMYGPIVQWNIHQNYQGRLEVSKDFEAGPEYKWEIGIALRKEDEALKTAIDKAIVELWAEGKIEAALAKYGVQTARPTGL